MDFDQDLLNTFIEETKENLQILEDGLLELEEDPASSELIDVVFRAMHSIKGSAGLVGMEKINDISHNLENILEEIRANKQHLPNQIFNLLFKGTDLMRKMIENQDYEGANYQGEIREILEASAEDGLLANGDANTDIIEKSDKVYRFFKIHVDLNENIFETGTDPLMLIIELEEKGKIIKTELDESRLPDLFQIDPYKLYLSWNIYLFTDETKAKIEDVFIFVKDDNDIKITDITENVDNELEFDQILQDKLVKQDIISQKNLDKLLSIKLIY
jgi:two-component system chemotaxis sensor kinase CheA